MMKLAARIAASLIFYTGVLATASASEMNGLDASSELLDEQLLIRVGPIDFPAKALDEMKLESLAETDWSDDDFVLGVTLNGESRAYPLAMMVWHQLANDVLGEIPILVTFCRNCAAGVVYDRVVEDQTLTFGMAGLIYRADILLYDKQTKSLWSRFLDESVAGPSIGKPLFGIYHHVTSLGEWKANFPESTIVSRENSYGIDYSAAPFGGEPTAGDGVFQTLPEDLRYHPAMPVVGIRHAGKTKVYPAGEVLLDGGTIEDDFDGVPVKLAYSAADQTFKQNFGGSIDFDITVWRKWTLENPDTRVFRASEAQQ